MPKSKSAKKAMKNFKDQYGDKKGEQIYYATAKKQNRNPDTFEKKESVCKLLDDIVVESNDGLFIVPKGTVVRETVSTGAIADRPVALNVEEDDEEEVDESSNSQISKLQLDH